MHPIAELRNRPDHSVAEERFITVGMSSAKRMLMWLMPIVAKT